MFIEKAKLLLIIVTLMTNLGTVVPESIKTSDGVTTFVDEEQNHYVLVEDGSKYTFYQNSQKIEINEFSSIYSVMKNIIDKNAGDKIYTEYSIGLSGMGEDIVVHEISALNPRNKNILLVFEIHGYEDHHEKDGQILVDIGHEIVTYFANEEILLSDYNLYIIPSMNPDALSHGTTHNGPGRCQISLGIDINRGFDTSFEVVDNKRFKTSSDPFKAPESQVLRDFVLSKEWFVIMDTHGWLDQTIGTDDLSNVMQEALGLSESLRYTPMNGQFIRWASEYSQHSALIELGENTAKEKDIKKVSQQFIEGLLVFLDDK